MTKKIALVTCYFQPNYGSQLQAYATQKAFDKLGLDNETINLEGIQPEINKRKMKYFLSKIFDKHTVLDKMATVRKVIAKKRVPGLAELLAQRTRKFKEFEGMFTISERYDSIASIGEASPQKYLAFVVGSDQLWLPSNITADYYTLNFVPQNICTIALSTSFGVSALPKRQAVMASKFLKRINYVSVREQSGQRLVKQLADRDVPVVCDPTILFNAEEWMDIVPKERFYADKYIFCYFLGNNPEQRDFVRKVRELTGYKIVQLQHCDEYIKSDVGFPDFAPYNVGPREFIQLIRDAELVFTDSFHCSVFSMLNRKKFFTFRRYNNDSIVSTNGRIYDFLNEIELSNRLLTAHENPAEMLKQEIDYNKVSDKLEHLRQFTWDWLKDSLKDAKII